LDKERGRERILSWLSLYFCFRKRPKKKKKKPADRKRQNKVQMDQRRKDGKREKKYRIKA
jgi:hypothetical protein